MSLPRLLILFALVLFGSIGIAALFKGGRSTPQTQTTGEAASLIEVSLESLEPKTNSPALVAVKNNATPQRISNEAPEKKKSDDDLPEADRIAELFNKTDPRLPFVETIVYKSRVPWRKGAPCMAFRLRRPLFNFAAFHRAQFEWQARLYQAGCR